MRFRLNEFLTPILEENEQYHIRYWYDKQTKNWIISVLDREENEVNSIYCGNVIDRDAELEYLKNDYQTMDCRKYKPGE